MGKVRLRTAGWEASREWLWSCCQGELGVCIPPAHTSTTSRAPSTPAGVTQGNVVTLNISKPPCWAPFPGSVVALALLEEQGRTCHELLLLQKGSVQAVAAALWGL